MFVLFAAASNAHAFEAGALNASSKVLKVSPQRRAMPRPVSLVQSWCSQNRFGRVNLTVWKSTVCKLWNTLYLRGVLLPATVGKRWSLFWKKAFTNQNLCISRVSLLILQVAFTSARSWAIQVQADRKQVGGKNVAQPPCLQCFLFYQLFGFFVGLP